MVKTPIVKTGIPFIGISFLLAVLLGVWLGVWAAVIPGVLSLFFSYFFRNPNRVIPADASLIVSPADGTVMEITDVGENDFVHGSCQKITIFMSVFDVHVNRSPVSGKIKFQEYTCGRFKPAYKNDVGYENERHTIGIEGSNISIVVTQIAGLLARRIDSWVTVGDELDKGVRYGMIKFASCVEVTMSKDIELLVKKGDKVKAGTSIIGRINK